MHKLNNYWQFLNLAIYLTFAKSPNLNHRQYFCLYGILKKKQRNLKLICEITHNTGKYLQGLMGPAKKASNHRKPYTMLLAWLWRVQKSLFCFCGLNGECVTYVILQCGRHKQNCYCVHGKTATIDKCAVSLRVISIAYLIGKYFKPDPSAVDKCKLKLLLQM